MPSREQLEEAKCHLMNILNEDQKNYLLGCNLYLMRNLPDYYDDHDDEYYPMYNPFRKYKNNYFLSVLDNEDADQLEACNLYLIPDLNSLSQFAEGENSWIKKNSYILVSPDNGQEKVLYYSGDQSTNLEKVNIKVNSWDTVIAEIEKINPDNQQVLSLSAKDIETIITSNRCYTKLYYINSQEEKERINLKDVDVFIQQINSINPKNKDVVFLRSQDIEDIITSNGGHSPPSFALKNFRSMVRSYIKLKDAKIDLTPELTGYLFRSLSPSNFADIVVQLHDNQIKLNNWLAEYLLIPSANLPDLKIKELICLHQKKIIDLNIEFELYTINSHDDRVSFDSVAVNNSILTNQMKYYLQYKSYDILFDYKLILYKQSKHFNPEALSRSMYCDDKKHCEELEEIQRHHVSNVIRAYLLYADNFYLVKYFGCCIEACHAQGIKFHAEIGRYVCIASKSRYKNCIDVLVTLKNSYKVTLDPRTVGILNDGDILSQPDPVQYALYLIESVNTNTIDSLAGRAARVCYINSVDNTTQQNSLDLDKKIKQDITVLLENYIKYSWFISPYKKSTAQKLINEINNTSDVFTIILLLLSVIQEVLKKDSEINKSWWRKIKPVNSSGNSRLQDTLYMSLKVACVIPPIIDVNLIKDIENLKLTLDQANAKVVTKFLDNQKKDNIFRM